MSNNNRNRNRSVTTDDNIIDSLELSGTSWSLDSSLTELLDAGKYYYSSRQYHNNKTTTTTTTRQKQKPKIFLKRLSLSDFDLDTTMIANIVHVLKVHSQHLKQLSLLECLGCGIDILVTTALTSTQINQLKISIGRLSTVAFSPIGHALGVGLQITTTLQRLVLQAGSNVFFTLSTDTAMSLEQGLAYNTTLKELHIQSCRFGEQSAIRSLSRGIRRNKHLIDVKIKSCFTSNGHALDDSGISDLLHGLETNINLKHLDLSGNKCLQNGIVAVASLLDKTKLQHLNLSCQCISSISDNNNNNNNGTAATNGNNDEFMNLSLLVAALGRTRTLKSLELRFNKLTDRDMAYLSAALNHNTSITYVGLGNNLITNTGISILSSRIPQMKTLQKLVLTNNLFDDEEGLLELSKSLRYNMIIETVEFLDGGRNDINNNNNNSNNQNTNSTNDNNSHNRRRTNHNMIKYYTDLNWGGRRYAMDGKYSSARGGGNNKRPLNVGLWSFVLERINKRFEMTLDISLHSVSSKERQADIIYCLLRNGPALFPT